MNRDYLFRPSEEDYELINALSNLLTAYQIPHNVHQGPADGWQITFDWCDGDIICSWASFHILESYCFPWDEGDITRTNPDEMARLICGYYKELLFTEEDYEDD